MASGTILDADRDAFYASVEQLLDPSLRGKTISLLAISASKLEKSPVLQLELSFAREDEKRRPGSNQGMARRVADGAIDRIRDRFGWEAVGYGSLALGISRSVPDEFGQLAEKEL